MFPLEHFASSLRKAQRFLAGQELPYHLTGGVASIAYGEPRLTIDLDYVIDRDRLVAGLAAFFESATEANYDFTEETIRHATASGKQFQLFDRATSAKLDFYPRELVPGELLRSRLVEVLPGLTLPVASRPDLVMAKLIWISKGSHKSRRDVRHLVRRATLEENATIQRMAGDLSLSSLLEEVLAESDEIIE